MRYVPYVTDHCREKAHRYGQIPIVTKIAEKLHADQSIANWDNFLPHPIIKKSLGKSYRLVADQYALEQRDDVIIVRFLDVMPRGSSEYTQFIQSPKEYCYGLSPTSDEMLSIDLSLDFGDAGKPLLRPSGIEEWYLYSKPGTVSESSEMVYESQDWVEQIAQSNRQNLLTRYYDLISKLVQGPVDSEKMHETCKRSNATIIYRRFDHKHLFLIAAFATPDDMHIHDMMEKYQHFMQSSDDITITEDLLLRYSHRSYPTLVLADETLWRNIEKSETGNLALSPEEAEILNSVRNSVSDADAYPLFINGRPGSGKSTILQYLFAENLYFHLSRSEEERTVYPPIYLTYGSRLLDAARTAVKTILRSNSELAIEGMVDLTDPVSASVIESSFGEFHRFLYTKLHPDKQQAMPEESRVDFTKFHRLWLEKSKRDPDPRIRALTPELTWHIIRTYIKGMRDDLGNYLDSESYAELPNKQRTVLSETFELVFEKVWEGWYRPHCDDNGLWDTQDLAREILNDNSLELSHYPVVFCDEAQDFTKIELEIIFRLSLFSRRLIQPDVLRSVPFAFAGDPFQTLNPTGFDWDAVQAGFHEKIVQGLDRFATSRLNFNYRELSFNYRSTANVVRFCNLIQLLRGIIFGNKNLIPQKVYFEDQTSPMPVYFNVDDPICRTKLEEQAEIVVVLPCQEGEEESYIANDPFLQSLAQGINGIRNFLSPMSAKGLEFSRVVLYKFGDEYTNKYPNLLSPLDDVRHVHDESETSLPLQYFVNRLYVAASRAMKRLIIIDSGDGIEGLWNRKDLSQFDTLLEKYPTNVEWSTSDLAYVTKGIETSWSEDRDDPLTLAINFFDAGKADSDPYKLRLAANSYRIANREDEAQKCDALRLELEGNYVDAGRMYNRLGDNTKAARCFWVAHSYYDVKNSARPDSHHHRAADYMLSKRSIADSKSFLAYVHNLINVPVWDEFISDEHWKDILFEVVAGLSTSTQLIGEWQEIYAQLSNLSHAGLHFVQSRDLARIAFNAKRYQDAVAMWDNSGRLGQDDEPYYRAKAEITEYPDKLEWLIKVRDYESVFELWNRHRDQQLPERHVQLMFSALIDSERDDDLLLLLERHPSEDRLVKALELFSKQKKYQILESIAKSLAVFRARNGDWARAIDLTIPNKSLKLPKSIQQKIRTIVIQEAAISETLANETIKTKSYVEEYLRIMLIENKWNNLVDIRSAGAAIERTGKIIDALEFYESIWRSKDIDANDAEIRFARERWIKCKIRQSDYSARSGREREFDKQLKEANSRARAWRIDINSLPEYPIIDDYPHDFIGQIESANVDEQKQKEIQDLLGLGWTSKRIAEVLDVDETVVRSFKNSDT